MENAVQTMRIEKSWISPEDFALKNLIKKIRLEEEELSAEFLTMKKSLREVSGHSSSEMLSKATGENEIKDLTRNMQRLNERLGKLRLALIRVRQGTFGFCISCGENIAIGRMKARYETSTCLDCAEAKERN